MLRTLYGGPEPSRSAKIAYMTTLPVAEASAALPQLVEQASIARERIEITVGGRRAAVLLGADDYDSLMDTVEILADAGLVRELDRSIREVRDGDVYSLDEVLAALRAAGRLP